MLSIDEIKKAIREIEISYDYNHSKNDYDIVLNLTELANLIKTLQGKAIDDLETKMLSNCSAMVLEGENVIVINRDILGFIIKQLRVGGKND